MVYDSVNNPAAGGADTSSDGYRCADPYSCTCGDANSNANSAIHTGGNRFEYGFDFANTDTYPDGYAYTCEWRLMVSHWKLSDCS